MKVIPQFVTSVFFIISQRLLDFNISNGRKRRGHHFRKSCRDQTFADFPFPVKRFWDFTTPALAASGTLFSKGDNRRNLVVADNPSDFFGVIFGNNQISPPNRRSQNPFTS